MSKRATVEVKVSAEVNTILRDLFNQIQYELCEQYEDEINRLNNIIYREISSYILKKYGMLDDTHYHDFLNELELKESDNNE